MSQTSSSRFQQVIETVETLPLDDQMLVIEIIRQRLTLHRRQDMTREIEEARAAYQRGEIQRGTVADLINELEK